MIAAGARRGQSGVREEGHFLGQCWIWSRQSRPWEPGTSRMARQRARSSRRRIENRFPLSRIQGHEEVRIVRTGRCRSSMSNATWGRLGLVRYVHVRTCPGWRPRGTFQGRFNGQNDMGSSDKIAGLSLAYLMGPSSVSQQFVGNGVSYDARMSLHSRLSPSFPFRVHCN